MSARTLPGLGLTGFWDRGADYKDTNDANLRLLSVVAGGLTVESSTSALPGSPTNGMIYIVQSSDGTNPNKIAVRDNGAWVYLTPIVGMEAWVKDTSTKARWSGSAWSTITYGGGGSPYVAPLIATTAAHLAANFSVTTGAWRTPTSWSIDHDTLSSYSSGSDFVVPTGATYCRVTMYTAWDSGGSVAYVQAYDTTTNDSYCGDIRTRNNETISSAVGPVMPCTPGNTIRFQYNSGNASGVIAGSSGTTFAKPCRIYIEWFSGWPG